MERLAAEIRDLEAQVELRKKQSKSVIDDLAKRISWYISFKANDLSVQRAAKDIMFYLSTPYVNRHPQIMPPGRIQKLG